MITERFIGNYPYRWRFLPSLMLFLTLIFTLVQPQPALAALVWQIQTVDSAGDLGSMTSLVLDSSGNPVISYYDSTNQDLKLVKCGNATCSSGNTIRTLDSAGDVGLNSSLKLDSSGRPVISYYDNTNQDLKLVKCGNATCSSGNIITTVDSDGYMGYYSSLALDSSGNPVISYEDSILGELKLVHCGNATCSSGNTFQILDSDGIAGRYNSLALDSSGNPVVSYYEIAREDLKLAKCGNPTCSSGTTIQTVDSTGDVGQYTSLKLDGSGNPVISYYDDANSHLKLVHCGNATCSSGNTFQFVDNATNAGRPSSLALASSGNPVVSYYDAINSDLKLAQCGNVTCSSGTTIQTVDSAGSTGWSNSLALDSSGNPVISYYDATNGNIKLARRVDVDTTAPVANPTQSPLAAPSGWNNTNVTITWNWTDSGGSGIDAANCTTSSVSSGSGTINLSATCKDLAGNTGTATYQVRVDPTAPTANPSQSPAANGAGWNNTNVTVNWNWVSTGAIIDTANCTTSSTSSGEGTLTLSATCKDVALNQRTATYGVKVDKTAPMVTVTGASNGATYTVGSVPPSACSTSDGISGVATLATLSSSGGNGDGTGSFTITCSGATDVAGNSTPPTSVSYTVNAQINSSVSQQSVSAVYNATSQACSSMGGSLPQQTITPTLRNTTSATFSGLFFRVKTIEYTTTQSGQPVLCNATSGNGGVGSTLTIPNSSLPGGNSQFNPGEDLVPTFQVGLPVRAQYRFFIDLYAVNAAAANDGSPQAGEYLGSFDFTLDEAGQPVTASNTLFLPLINR